MPQYKHKGSIEVFEEEKKQSLFKVVGGLIVIAVLLMLFAH